MIQFLAGSSALKWAKVNNGLTLEMTRTGRLLEKFSPYLPARLKSKLWDMASLRFAQGATGAVEVFHNATGVYITSTWARIEYKELARRGVNILYNIIR